MNVVGTMLVAAALGVGGCGGKEKDKGSDSSTNTGTVTGTNSGTGTGTPTTGTDLIFPADNPWNTDISAKAVDPSSAALLATCAGGKTMHPDFGTTYEGAPNGIPYVIVSGTQAKVPVTFEYDDESDPGPYPIPADAPIEGGPDGDGDRHVIVIDKDARKLYELFSATPEGGGTSWRAGSGAIFDLTSNDLRKAGWTSADAAGLPIFPGLVRYDEVFEKKVINHALRFTCPTTRRAYVHPARHFASDKTEPAQPPMGMRIRLKKSLDISGYSASNQVILKALQTYGMFLADNGGPLYLSGSPDARWSDDDLHDLKQIKTEDFEVLELGTLVTD